MKLKPGLLDTSPAGVILTEEQKHQFLARCGIECILKRASDILGFMPPNFVFLPVSKNGEPKKFVFITTDPKQAARFGLPRKIDRNDPWSVHAEIGMTISTFLESRGQSLAVNKPKLLQ